MTNPSQEILINDDELNNISPNRSNSDSWVQRTFKPLQKGSQRGATFLAIMTAFGTGVFTLHHIFEYCGIIWGTLLEIAVALSFMYFGYVLIYTSKKFPEIKSFTQLMDKSLGPLGRNFYNLITVIYLFTVAIGGLIAFSKLTYVNFSTQIWSIFSFVDESNRNINYFCKRSVWVFGIFLFLIILQRDLSSLQYVSLFSLSVYALVLILMSIQLPYYIEEQKQDGTYEQNWYSTSFEPFLISFGLLLTSFNFNTQYFGIKNTLEMPRVYRQKKVIFRSYVVLFIFYYFIGGMAYWSLGQNANLDIFIMRQPLKGSRDILMIILRTLLLIGVILCAALNVFPIKQIIDPNCFEWSFGKNFLISLLLTLIPVLGASLFDNVTQYLTIAGTLGGTIISFTFPGIVAIKENIYNGFQKGVLIFMTVIITIGGMLGTYVCLKNFHQLILTKLSKNQIKNLHILYIQFYYKIIQKYFSFFLMSYFKSFQFICSSIYMLFRKFTNYNQLFSRNFCGILEFLLQRNSINYYYSYLIISTSFKNSLQLLEKQLLDRNYISQQGLINYPIFSYICLHLRFICSNQLQSTLL